MFLRSFPEKSDKANTQSLRGLWPDINLVMKKLLSIWNLHLKTRSLSTGV